MWCIFYFNNDLRNSRMICAPSEHFLSSSQNVKQWCPTCRVLVLTAFDVPSQPYLIILWCRSFKPYRDALAKIYAVVHQGYSFIGKGSPVPKKISKFAANFHTVIWSPFTGSPTFLRGELNGFTRKAESWACLYSGMFVMRLSELLIEVNNVQRVLLHISTWGYMSNHTKMRAVIDEQMLQKNLHDLPGCEDELS